MRLKSPPHVIRSRWNLSRLFRDRRGIAATEFALCLPVMVVLFFGLLEASDLFTVNRRVAFSTNALADLIAQEPTILESEMSDAVTGVIRLLEPTDTSTLDIKIISVVKGPNPGDKPTVHWSREQKGTTPDISGVPYAAGSNYTGLDDDTALDPNASLIVVEVGYLYKSQFGGHVISTPFDFQFNAKRWPRKSTRVQLCQTPGDPPTNCTS